MNCYLQEERPPHTRSPSNVQPATLNCVKPSASKANRFVTLTSYANSNTSFLEALLSFDAHLTRLTAICADPQTHFQKALRLVCYLLEISGHGVPWFVACGVLVAAYWYTHNDLVWVYMWNMFVILVADITVVAPIKLYFQRPRPKLNRGRIPLSVSSVDKYAFPSGHTSRCVALAALFCYMSPFELQTNLFCAWAGLVCMSRILIGRHHILDVVAGVLAGLFVFKITQLTLLIL